MAADKPRKLTARQRRFVEEYARRPVAVTAYFHAYGREHVVHGETRPRAYKVVRAAACRLLANVNIQAELSAVRDANADRLEASYQKFLDEQSGMAFSDIGDAFRPNPDGGYDLPTPLSKMDPVTRRGIKSLVVKVRREADPDGGPTIREVEEVKVVMHDKAKALDTLSKHLGWCRERDPLEAVLALLPPEAAALVRAHMIAAARGA